MSAGATGAAGFVLTNDSPAAKAYERAMVRLRAAKVCDACGEPASEKTLYSRTQSYEECPFFDCWSAVICKACEARNENNRWSIVGALRARGYHCSLHEPEER